MSVRYLPRHRRYIITSRAADQPTLAKHVSWTSRRGGACPACSPGIYTHRGAKHRKPEETR